MPKPHFPLSKTPKGYLRFCFYTASSILISQIVRAHIRFCGKSRRKNALCCTNSENPQAHAEYRECLSVLVHTMASFSRSRADTKFPQHIWEKEAGGVQKGEPEKRVRSCV